jgi:DNA-binding Lrp family transcriptional regulator
MFEFRIKGYTARLDAKKIGFRLRAITCVNLRRHSESMDESFVALLSKHAVVREAYSVSGYILHITTKGLTAISYYIHQHLLPHQNVTQVCSAIILLSIKEVQGNWLTDK